jgi:hypothetical protein
MWFPTEDFTSFLFPVTFHNCDVSVEWEIGEALDDATYMQTRDKSEYPTDPYRRE